MSQEIEIEFKNLLTINEYDYLLHNFPFPEKGQTQTNFYFETDSFDLRNNNAALRIREKDEKYKLTLKEPHPDGILETHDLLTKTEALAWINGNIIKKKHTTVQLEALSILPENLHCYGNLTTERREVYLSNVLLVLDYSTFNGHFDYELEIEASSKQAGLKMFNFLLKEHNIQKKDTPTKIERFFSTLKE